LHALGALEGLVTDAWIAPGSALARIAWNLRGRFHPQLDNARVHSGGIPWLAVDAFTRVRRRIADSSDCPLLLSRNA
jgi:hypothetical protein